MKQIFLNYKNLLFYTNMKKFIKKLIWYDKFYNFIKSSFIYQWRKRINGQIANMINWNPSKDFFIIWITGTNWKTTTANMLHKVLNELLAPTVMISTATIKIWNQTMINDKKMTSLDTYQLQSLLADAKAQWCKIAILETSSQGLDQFRFEWVKFDYAVLTNITKEHLDYHKDMTNYAKAKKNLFKYVLKNQKDTKYGSFPMDDKIGREWFDELAFDKKISFSIQGNSILKAENIIEWVDSTSFDIKYLWNSYPTTAKILGTYNIYNYLAALSVAIQIGLNLEKSINSLSEFEWVDGRMEKVKHNWITYFVDFAHTPDALEKTLKFLHSIKWESRLILVFWAPGNRDKGKRPEMWRIWLQYADIAIATDDDPDTENRLSIIKQLIQEIDTKNNKEKKLFTLPEREFAVKFASKIARSWDIVMLAGKGHEPIQWTNFGTRVWNDKKELLKNLNID